MALCATSRPQVTHLSSEAENKVRAFGVRLFMLSLLLPMTAATITPSLFVAT
jgi:hypothetical protein